MVLPEWIEHSTSPLPRGCSTTELRQRNGRRPENLGRERGRITATSPPAVQGNARTLPAGGRRGYEWPMANDTGHGKPPKKGGREARLAAALRENLRRRKAQVRGRDAEKHPSGEQLREPEAGSKR